MEREGASEGANQTAAVAPEFAALGRNDNQVTFVKIEVLLEPETHERARAKHFKPAPAARPGAQGHSTQQRQLRSAEGQRVEGRTQR
eukprot:SAG11_NODE_2681_length_3103_cov_2.475699_2_plen_87_part_00